MEHSRVLREVGALHAKVFNAVRAELGAQVPPMGVMGDPAEKALAALMRDQETLEGFAEKAKHALAVAQREAIDSGSTKFLGASVWRPESFAVAVAMAVGEKRRPAQRKSAFAVADEVFDALEKRESGGQS